MSLAKVGAAGLSRELDGFRILVADDCSDNQYVMNRLLVRLGAQVSLVDDGADAYALALKEHFDVLLLDIQMPVMDGYEAIEKLNAANYQRPILAVTAGTKDEDRDSIMAAGFAARVTKPIDSKILSQTIRDVVALNRAKK